MGLIKKFLFFISMMILVGSCGGGGTSISTLPTTDAFDETQLDFNPKIDILWVVDPSRSMKTEIESIQNNIQEFVSDFITKGYDFQMGVITTAAWSHQAYLANPSLNILDGGGGAPLFARLHRGDCTNFTGVGSQPAILTGNTASDVGTFSNFFKVNFDVYGIALDTSGCGLDFFTNYAAVPGNIFASYTAGERSELSVYTSDERPLQSMKTFLNEDKVNNASTFARPGAYLAVIIISDEFDGSRDSLDPSLTFVPNQVGDAVVGNHVAQDYINFLRDDIKAGDASKFGIFSFVNLSLEGINIARDAAGPENTFDINGDREAYIANLNKVRGEIITNATAYPLNREPIPNTIRIQVVRLSGIVLDVPQSTGPNVDGWVYDPNVGEFGAITFIGSTYVPAQGDGIIVDYTPKFLTNGQVNDPYLLLSNNRILENSITGSVLGTVSLVNKTIKATDTVAYQLQSSVPAGAFQIDPVSGVVTVANPSFIETEGFSVHQLTVNLTVTTAENIETQFNRVFTVSILDVPDEAPVASNLNIEVSEATAQPNGTIVISGNTSFFVGNLDASEIHTYSSSNLNPPSVGTLVFNTNGTFTYTVNRVDLDLAIGDPDFVFTFNYTVTGTNLVLGGVVPDPLPAVDQSTASVSITITPTNNIPKYLSLTNPINGGNPITPNNEGVSFGKIPLQETDISVSGSFSGSVASLIGTGSANLITGPNAEAYHEVVIAFPNDALYEVECVRIYRDESSSLGNAIYQIQTGGVSPVTISREVFPVGISGNSNRSKPSNARGACDALSSSYFTIYTDRNYIGGTLRLIRPFGSKNPQNHSELRLDQIEVYGTEARFTEIDLMAHFQDEDILGGVNGVGDTLSFYVTDAFGEGPAPGWASVVGTELRLLPSASVNDTLGVLAVDLSGAEAFATIRVIGSGGGTVSNAPPISILKLDDTKRGGLSMRRWGGTNTTVPAMCLPLASGDDNRIVHIEIDNFIEQPFSTVDAYYDILNVTANPEQGIHNGDTRSGETENGWCSVTVHEDNKYPTASATFCSQSLFNNSSNIGKIIPCLNSARSYGEVYSGYFVPAVSGVYKFRTRIVDNTVLLRIAPTEYHEDTTKIFIANWQDAQLEASLRSLINYPTEDLGSTAARNSEFAGSGTGTSLTNYRAIPYDTNIFFDLNGIPSANNYNSNYTKGYMYMTQGNVYAFEMRFGEGGGAVFFDFEFNRRDLDGSNWDGWRTLDASVVVPDRGLTTAHTPFVIPIGVGNSVNLEAKELFYDAELDLLEYSARLVNLDGTTFGTGQISEIGLNIGLLSGTLAGTLNSNYTSIVSVKNRPRIVFRATERFGGSIAESLPIKLE